LGNGGAPDDEAGAPDALKDVFESIEEALAKPLGDENNPHTFMSSHPGAAPQATFVEGFSVTEESGQITDAD
jgi:hypothetical protein